MNTPALVAVVMALLGSALIGGVFFAFSNFVMKALSRVSSSEGIAAMQEINIVVINPWFLGAFVGTAILSLGMIGASLLLYWSHTAAMFYLSAGLCYFMGTFLVTLFGNVPLNNRLAAISPGNPAADIEWEHYLDRWTKWNHLRMVSAMVSALLIVLGLMER
ncbi:MAG: DUF1772 domain-containing protein [Gammaproteobacteria bacterium]|nr:DUF1772 domain-containing protein [Gammaproteobacteria bacterium]